MAKGVTTFKIPYVKRNRETDNSIVNMIEQYLKLFGFRQMIDNENKIYYQAGDGMMTAIKGFSYKFTNNSIIINAWMNKKGKERKLKGIWGAVWIINYRDELSQMIHSIKEIINSNTFVTTARDGINMMNTEVNENTVNQTFNSSNNQRSS